LTKKLDNNKRDRCILISKHPEILSGKFYTALLKDLKFIAYAMIYP